MKPIPAAVLAILAASPLAFAAPRLVISTPSLAPESTIDLYLDHPAVEASEIGKPVANTWLVITPELPGSLTWKSPGIATFSPSQPPAMGVTYKFSIPAGLHYLDDQGEVPEGEITTISTESFRVVTASSQSRWSEHYVPSTAEWLVVFNDAVDAATAAEFFKFYAARHLVAATVVQATRERAGSYAGYKVWAERFPATGEEGSDEVPEEPSPDDLLPNVLVVSPATPLPPGRDWRLLASPELPNAAGNARSKEISSHSIGEILPFVAGKVTAITSLNQPRSIIIDFNHRLPETLPENFISENLRLSPEPTALEAKTQGHRLILTAADLDQSDLWNVTIRPPLISAGGLALAAESTASALFERSKPSLSLPSADEGQLANGRRSYDIHTVNLASTRIRIKQLSGEDLVRTFLSYGHYKGAGTLEAPGGPAAPLPFALIPGAKIHDESIILEQALDTTKTLTLKWDEILPEGTAAATLFLDASGVSHSGLEQKSRSSTQAVIQLTDIGLAWKITGSDAFIYAFSCTTGQPLSGAKVTLFGEDAAVLHEASTDAEGKVLVPRLPQAQALHASIPGDEYVTAFDSSMENVGLWHFPVRHSWRKPAEMQRRAFLFTDRTLYRPGETARLKGIVRTQRGNAITAAEPAAARLVVMDPTYNELLSQDITLSESGSFDFTYPIPDGKTGTYRIRLEFPEELALAEAMAEDDWYESEVLNSNASFGIQIQVEDFRRNAFEIEQSLTQQNEQSVRAAISARYYQGQAVSAGKVGYFTRITDKNIYPERFRDYLFGDHKVPDWTYWYHYFGYRWDSSGESGRQTTQHQGDLILTSDGTGEAIIQLPESEFPSAREISVSMDITDANLQTLTSTSTLTVHPASVYIGVTRNDRLIRAGEQVNLKTVAVTPDGEPFPGEVIVTAKLTREINHPVKTLTPSGAVFVRNDTSHEFVAEELLKIPAAASAGEGFPLTLVPKDTGRHLLTLRGTDAEGRAFVTVTHFHVYGTKEYPWAYEDGMRVKLVAEKKAYSPGETARILVLSPIEGTALVTVEREKVLRSFSVPLRADHPVIEIPIEEDDAPNAYVSVLIIKGSQDSAREHREPQLRLGYCELTVHNLRDRLDLTMEAFDSESGEALASFRPGDEVSLQGTVALAGGAPAAGAEITFYAEDEGTLAVAGYETPDPLAYFYNPRLLSVAAGTSFQSFLSENPENRNFHNKGFFIGGGDGSQEMFGGTRRNFDPCATWVATLTADAQGRFSHSFTLPDTLTRYRLIAVAHHSAERFGHAEAALLVNKPLMVEPKTPRHAHQDDSLTLQTLVQNASEFVGTWEVSFNPHAGSGPPVCAGDSLPQTVTLNPGESATLAFPVSVLTTGEAVVSWKAIPVSYAGAAPSEAILRSHSDVVEARFATAYPMPLLRQTKFIRVDPRGNPEDLLRHLDRRLLDGDGFLDLEIARSPLAEAGESIDYLLQYPYGCLEQTTSSLIPWLSLESLRHISPKLSRQSPERVAAAIQSGADRILSMQLPDGSFSYWQGQRETVDWATSYGGLGLILAAQSGAHVPASAIDRLCNYLIENLRGLDTAEKQLDLENSTRALWVLALADRPQHSYHQLLMDRLDKLPESSRSFLALAISRAGGENALQLAKNILNAPPAPAAANGHWMRWEGGNAMRLLAWASVDPADAMTASTLDALIKERDIHGHWRTTWVNGWSMLAVAKVAEAEKSDDQTHVVQLVSSTEDETIRLEAGSGPESRSFLLGPDLQVSLAGEAVVYVRLKLAAKPPILPIQPVSTNGMAIDRSYEKVLPDGTFEPLDQPSAGDLIRVSLRITLPNNNSRYLVIDDPLPAIFEAVNSDFDSQRSARGIRTSEKDWQISHSELRDDRAVFFFNRFYNSGTYTVTYLARCTLRGEAIAPPAKIEEMYNPEQFALSASRSFTAE